MLNTPYAGLMPFTEEQAPFFFGRDSECNIITANLMASRLTLLYGPSGVGKSSVLNAGVVHQLRQKAREDSGAKPDFAIVLFRDWRDEPLASLETTIAHESGVTGQGPTFADRLQSCAEQIGGDVLIILDQFEEYFMYHGGEEADGTFAVEFARAVNRRDLRTSFLVSMREDSIAKLDLFKGRITSLFENRLSIDRLNRDQAREAIVRPVEQFNRLVAKPPEHYTIDSDLVEEVLDQVRATALERDDVGRGRLQGAQHSGIETPHLQLVMTRLWQEEIATRSTTLRLVTLKRLGGASEIVKRHVDSALDALSASERDAAATIFQYLVTPAGTKIALGVEDLYPNVGMSAPELRSLLIKLSSGESRILATVAPAPDQPARERYQIFHDVLAEKVLAWRTGYVKEKQQRAAEAIAETERQRAEKEARAAAGLRRLLALVGVLLLVAVTAAWFAWRQTLQANIGRAAAEKSRREADLSRVEAEGSKHTADASRDEVLAANARNAGLEAEKEQFRLQAQEAQLRLAGRTEQADKKKDEAAAAAERMAVKRREEEVLTAEALKARNAAQTSLAQAEQLKASQAAVDTSKPLVPSTKPPATENGAAAASPPVETPSESTAPKATPIPKPAIAGDYRETYRKAIDAKNRKHWDDAARLFQVALQQNPTDTGERINISGFGNIEPYVPKFYLGLALKNLNRCPDAIAAWSQSEQDGAVQKTSLYKALQQGREECARQR